MPSDPAGNSGGGGVLTAGALRHQRSYVAAHTRTHRQTNRRERTQARRYARAHTEGMRKGDRETDKETTQNELKAVSTVGSCVPHTGRHLARWPLYLCRDTELTRQETPLDREVHTEVEKAHTHTHTHRTVAAQANDRGGEPRPFGAAVVLHAITHSQPLFMPCLPLSVCLCLCLRLWLLLALWAVGSTASPGCLRSACKAVREGETKTARENEKETQ